MRIEDIPVLIQIVFILLLITVAAFIVYVRSEKQRKRDAPIETACLNDIPAIVQALATNGEDGHFFVFIWPKTEMSPINQMAIQFTVEDGQVCFDWLLDDGLGKAQRSDFEELARRKGWPISDMKTAGFHYLRIKGLTAVQIAEIGRDVLSTLCHVGPTEQIEISDDAPQWRVGA